jgi:hypothetical protein
VRSGVRDRERERRSGDGERERGERERDRAATTPMGEVGGAAAVGGNRDRLRG